MIRTLILSACAAVLLTGLAQGAASAGGVTLPMSPVVAPEVTAPSFPSTGCVLPANAGGAEHELCLDGIATSTGSNSYSGAVKITEAPEISTWAMTLLGFAGLGFMGSLVRKRRGADPIGL